MNVFININTSKLVSFTNKLEKLRRSDLPIAIRQTLNRAAFDVKQVTMPESTGAMFDKRNPNFFKGNSKVSMAQGFDVPSMRSLVGFISSNLQYNNKAVRELEQQEYGGTIDDRSLIPTESARTGNNATPVRPMNRLKTIGARIRKAIDVKDVVGPSRRFRFVKAAIKAGRGGYVIGGLRRMMLYRIDSISRKFGRTYIRQTPIYSYKQGRSVTVRQTKFMRHATLKSAGRLNKFFIDEANRRIKKAMR